MFEYNSLQVKEPENAVVNIKKGWKAILITLQWHMLKETEQTLYDI